MIIFRRALGLVRRYARPFVLINVAYFGIVCGGLAYGAWDRENRDAYMSESKQQAAELLPPIFDAARGGQVAKTVGLIFVTNLCAGSFLYITLPSLLVPFGGLLLGAVRAFIWGLIFSPSLSAFNGAVFAYGLLVGLLLFLEGEGYVLAMLGSYIQGKSFLFPHGAGANTRWQGYKSGATWTMQLYALVAGMLLVAAVYEAMLVIYIMPLLK
jgi:hypothetical protein